VRFRYGAVLFINILTQQKKTSIFLSLPQILNHTVKKQGKEKTKKEKRKNRKKGTKKKALKKRH